MVLSPAGSELDSVLDNMDVDALWQSGEYVFWQTGITMPKPPPASEGYETETHCSAFAAATALKLGVPFCFIRILLPRLLRRNILRTPRRSGWRACLKNGRA